LFKIARSPNVHVHDLGTIEEEVVVKRCYFQSVVQRYGHHGVDFVLGHVDDLDIVLAFEEGELRPRPVDSIHRRHCSTCKYF